MMASLIRRIVIRTRPFIFFASLFVTAVALVTHGFLAFVACGLVTAWLGLNIVADRWAARKIAREQTHDPLFGDLLSTPRRDR